MVRAATRAKLLPSAEGRVDKMAEVKICTFTFKEIVEALIKKENIHEGIWGVYVEFGIGAANVGQAPGQDVLPAAIVPVMKIGIQRLEVENNLSVDASKVNPEP